MTIRARIERKIVDRLAPTELVIEDESHRHAGHAGHRPGGETHFRVTVVSAAFAGLSRVARHRLVYALLAEEMAERVHALSVDLLTPEERLRGKST